MNRRSFLRGLLATTAIGAAGMPLPAVAQERFYRVVALSPTICNLASEAAPITEASLGAGTLHRMMWADWAIAPDLEIRAPARDGIDFEAMGLQVGDWITLPRPDLDPGFHAGLSRIVEGQIA